MNENEIPGITVTGSQTGGEPVQETQTVTSTEPTAQPVVESKPEQTFTKSQLNDIMRKRVERSHNAFFKRYGVNNLTELDNLFGKAAGYDAALSNNSELSQRYGDLENQYKDLTKRYGFKSCNIDEKKIQDIETYFKGKGIDISEESLIEELKTHPDWVNKVSTIQQLGAEVSVQSDADQRAEAARIFGVKL